MAIAVRPSSPALRMHPSATPGSWCCMASRWGSTSLVKNSAAVRAMARCSSVKSSGVKISSGDRSSIRKAPPFGLLRVALAMSVQPFEYSGGALPAAHAHRHHAISAAAPFQIVQQRRGELRAGAAERMSQRDRAAVWIDPVHRQAGVPYDRERLDCEGFVQLDDAQVFQAQPRELKSLRNGDHRTDTHDLRGHAGQSVADQAGPRLQPELRRFALRSEEHTS